MKVRFPCYTTSFSCGCPVQEATKRILETVACQCNHFKVIEAYYTGIQNIILSTRTGEYLYYNSFMPIVGVKMREEDSITQVSVFFKLQKSTKILMTLISMLALLYEITLLVLCIMDQLSTHVLLCLPLGMIISVYILSNVGLYFSSRGVLRILFAALACEDAKYTPSIHKSREIQ